MTMEAFDRRYETDARRPFADLVPELPPIGRVGLMILIAGWSVLLVEPFLPMLDGRAGGFAIARLGQSAILTGAALAIVGLLMTIASRHAEAPVARGPLPDLTASVASDFEDDEPVESSHATRPAAESRVARAVAAPAPAMQPPALPQAAQSKPSSALQGLPTDGSMIVVARGQVDDRCFLVLADGSVVIETLLGQRRFKSLPDARDFIGGGSFLLHDTVQIPLTGGRMMPTAASTSEPAAKVPAGRVLRHV